MKNEFPYEVAYVIEEIAPFHILDKLDELFGPIEDFRDISSSEEALYANDRYCRSVEGSLASQRTEIHLWFKTQEDAMLAKMTLV